MRLGIFLRAAGRLNTLPRFDRIDLELSNSGDKIKIAVVDVDGTLALDGSVSRASWRLAAFFQRLGRRTQRANTELIRKLGAYDRIVILTSRDARDEQSTKNQLVRFGLKFDSIVTANRKDVLSKWKSQEIAKLGPGEAIIWIDDLFSDTRHKLVYAPSGLDIVASNPTEFAGKSTSSWEGLECL